MRNKKRKTAKAEVKQNVKLFETESNNDIKVYELDNDFAKNPTHYRKEYEILYLSC